MFTKMLAILLMLFVYEIQSQGARSTYNIVVKTGNYGYSGTDANVFIIIYGRNGNTGKIMLRSSQTNNNKFETGQTDKFTEDGFNVGRITRIRIGHDNRGSGPGWYLDQVAIKVGDTNCEITFNAYRWVMSGALQADLLPHYNPLYCPKEKSIRCDGQDDGCCTTETPCKVDEGDCDSDDECAGSLTCGNANCPWGDADDCCKRDTTKYNIDVKTGNVGYAGTDANVFIIIYGEKTNTGKIMLLVSQTHRNEFERNHMDKFTKTGLDVGRISKIRIGHDNTGDAPGWYLQRVVINVNGCEMSFTANRWVEKGKLETDLYPVFDKTKCNQGKMAKYDIVVKTSNVNDAGTDANVFLIIYGNKDDTGKLMLRKSKTNNDPFENSDLDKFTAQAIDVGWITKIRIGHDNTGSGPGWHLQYVTVGFNGENCKLSFHAGEWVMKGKLEVELYPSLSPNSCDDAMASYKIYVYTGNKKYAGTDANVFIIIHGKTGKTGRLMLRMSRYHKDPFEQNHLDAFTGSAIDVGRISAIRIGHDNKGGYPGWYLDKIVIQVNSCTSTFSARLWLQKRLLSIDLYPTLEKGTC